MTSAQGSNRVVCRIIIQPGDNAATIFAIGQTSRATQIEYKLSLIHVSEAGTNVSNQSGIYDIVDTGRAATFSRVSVGINHSSLIEAQLQVREIQTGNICEATESFQGSL